MKRRTLRLGIATLLLMSPPLLLAAEDNSKEEVAREVSEAVDAIKHYAASNKDEAVERAEDAIEKLDERIGILEKKIHDKWNDMDESTRQSAQETLDGLRKQRDELSTWYDKMQHSSARAWGEVRQGFIESFEVLRKSLGKAREAYNGDE